MTEQERLEKIEALLQTARTLYDQNYEAQVMTTIEADFSLDVDGVTHHWTRAKIEKTLVDIYAGLKDSFDFPLGSIDLLPDWFLSIETLFTELQSAIAALTAQERNEQPSQPSPTIHETT